MARAPATNRDPFLFGNESRDVKVETAVQLGPDPFVASILYSPTRRVAVVEGRIVSIGDAIGAFKVADIQKDAVIFTTPAGDRRRVPLHGPPPEGIRR
jgi:hypothetical protein